MDNWLQAKMGWVRWRRGVGKHHPSCVAAAADAVGLSFEEMRPHDGARPFYACGRFGISRRSPARSKSGDAEPGNVRWLAA
jgi:hypothetical protein